MKENCEECADWKDGLFSFLLGVLIGLAFFGTIFGLSFLSASPYQLNLTTGVITDLNSSNNETANITIYVLPNITNINNITQINNVTNITYTNYTNLTAYQNVTWNNITNITNLTCVNCTQNYTNITELRMYNYTLNGTSWNGTFYNRTEVDEKFAIRTDFNSLTTAIASDLNTLNLRIGLVNTTAMEKTVAGTTKNNNTALWIVIAVVGLISIFAMLVAGNKSGGN